VCPYPNAVQGFARYKALENICCHVHDSLHRIHTGVLRESQAPGPDQ
jgi:hypothetical protein